MTTAREKQHMGRVAALGCIACRKLGYYDSPAEVHHIREGVGAGQRASHFETIPLCPIHHRMGTGRHNGADDPAHTSIHRSPQSFNAKFGTERELLTETLELIKKYAHLTIG